MTIINVHLEQRRALVASNTQGYRPDGSHGYSSKIYALPHAQAVLTGRGQLALLFNVFADCNLVMGDFDATAARLGSSMVTRMAELRAEATRDGVPKEVPLMSEVALIGWSVERGRMVCHYSHASDPGPVRAGDLHMMRTWEDSWGVPPEASTSDEMAALAKVQAYHAERTWPGKGWLGDLTLCEITPESITFTAVKDFWK